MAFKDGVGVGQLTPLVMRARGVAESIQAIPLRPDHLSVASTGHLTFLVSNTTTTDTDVQVRVSTSAGFGTTVYTQTLLALSDGQYSVLATGLIRGTTYYWQVRASEAGADVWTAWSVVADGVPSSFVFDDQRAAAHEYLYVNLGAFGDPAESAHEQIELNVGLTEIPDWDAHEQVEINVGYEITLDDGGREYIYLNLDENIPVPHIWFLWRPFGFAGNEVWAYGHGFGNPQIEYDGSMMIDPGPDYSTSDETAGVNEWYEQIAGPDAYTEDRRIWPGTWDDEPIVDTEVGIIRFIIPAIVMPDLDPVTHRMYVTHDGGVSNLAPWIMYPTIPVAAGNVQRGVGTRNVMRLTADFGGGGIEQLWFYTDQPEYVITDGLPQRPPLFTARATTVAQLGTWSTEAALASALSVDLGADHRWVADAGELTPRPDLGTGVTVWDPSVGATTKGWRLEGETAPYVEPAYTIPSRLGDLAIPAMIFPGDAFGELTTDVPAGPTFTFAIVAVLHAPPNGRGTVFSTYRDSVAPETHDLEIYAEDGKMRLTVGGRYAHRDLRISAGRPVIIVCTVDVDTSQLIIIDEAPSSHVSGGLMMEATGNGAYLGRSWRIDDRMDVANMDVLEVAWWDTALSSADAWSAANKLDGIYGVTG